MRPVLYLPNEKNFVTNGIGVLSEATMCTVTEHLDGGFELLLKYPVTGRFYADIVERCLILAKPNGEDRPQPFRIYRISKPMNGIITVYAEHISYDLSGVQVSPFTADTAPDALAAIKAHSVTENIFDLSTDKDTEATMKVNVPKSARACLLGSSGSVLSTYKGDFKFDRFSVSLLKRRGSDKGFTVRYGVNLTDITQDRNVANTYTGIYPYFYDDMSGTLVELDEKVLYADGSFDYVRIKNVDLSSEFEEIPSKDKLRERAEKYLEDNNIGKPKVSIDLRFESIRNTEEYKDLAFLENVELGDDIGVVFEKLKVNAHARCITTVYDSLRERYDSIEIGDATPTVSDTVKRMENSVAMAEARAANSLRRTAATIETKVDDNTAEIEAIVKYIGSGADGGVLESVAKLEQAVSANESSIALLTERVTDNETTIGYIETKVDDNTAEIEAIAKLQTETEVYVAALEADVGANSSKIGLIVETSEDGNNSVNGSVIIEAINGESTAQIKADRINLVGYVTVSGLENGETSINGACIDTGVVKSQNYALADRIIFTARATLPAGSYYIIDLDRDLYYSFTTTKAISYGGRIRLALDDSDSRSETGDGELIEALVITESSDRPSAGTRLQISDERYFSTNGTLLDLETGAIISKGFALTEDGTVYISGSVNADTAILGGFGFIEGSIFPIGADGFASADGVHILKDKISYTSNNYVDSTEWMEFVAGMDEIHLMNTHSALQMTKTNAYLWRTWLATPYTDSSASPSNLVTKQDLINLGLISA